MWGNQPSPTSTSCKTNPRRQVLGCSQWDAIFAEWDAMFEGQIGEELAAGIQRSRPVTKIDSGKQGTR